MVIIILPWQFSFMPNQENGNDKIFYLLLVSVDKRSIESRFSITWGTVRRWWKELTPVRKIWTHSHTTSRAGFWFIGGEVSVTWRSDQRIRVERIIATTGTAGVGLVGKKVRTLALGQAKKSCSILRQLRLMVGGNMELLQFLIKCVFNPSAQYFIPYKWDFWDFCHFTKKQCCHIKSQINCIAERKTFQCFGLGEIILTRRCICMK